MTPSAVTEAIRQSGRCMKCFKLGHHLKDYKFQPICHKCKRDHMLPICPIFFILPFLTCAKSFFARTFFLLIFFYTAVFDVIKDFGKETHHHDFILEIYWKITS